MTPAVRPSAFVSACLLLAGVLCADPVAAAEGAPPATGTPAAPPATPPAAARNIGGPGDFGLRQKLVKRYNRDPDLASGSLKVVLVNGGVVLSGKVPHWAARRRALISAGAERGIVNVTDQMEIERGTIKDGAILKAMTAILAEQREALALASLDIAVSDGVVTMAGTVKDFASRVRAEETVGTVLGAVRIINRLQPANAPSGTDDATVRHALARYLGDFREYPYPGEIQVGVSQGTAILSGRVPLYLARQQAATMAALVGGVRAVDNRIVIDPSLQLQGTTVTEAK